MPSDLAEKISCIDIRTGELVEPRSVWVTLRCIENHVTRVMDNVETDCHLCEEELPYAPADAYPCKHCSAELEDHAGTACLFAPTSFEPMDREQLQRESDEMWAALESL